MKLQVVCIFLFSLFILNMSAQSVTRGTIASGGKENQSATLTLFSNIGELAVNTFQTSTSTLTQGFEQPENILIVGIPSTVIPDAFAIVISPNPAKDKVYISNKEENAFQLRIYDINGRLLKYDLLNESNCVNQYIIDVSSYQSGIYFISIINPETKLIVGNYKLIKL